jgi:hypothetical protein
MRLLIALLLTSSAFAAFRPLPAFDPAKVQPSMFADDELDLPYYLVHFERVANAVFEEGANRGFINIAVWRSPKDNQPHNARIMESILSLAFFYTTKRPWNVYYGAPGLRDRLEAALDFWVRSQAPTGAFSEYKPQGWSLAPTAFATKFMGRTLRMLSEGPPLDSELMERVKAAQRKAILFVLTDDAMWKHALRYSNQFTNVYPGALAWLSQRDDPEVRRLLEARMKDAATQLQSPAGYFYEAGGADWSYNLGTHHSNLLGAYFYQKRENLVEEERKFVDWLSYNVVPDKGEWVLNRAIETRRLAPVVSFSYRHLITDGIPKAAAFLPTREEMAQRTAELRRKLNAEWPKVEPLRVGDFTAYAPYAFLHREQREVFPTTAEKAAAMKLIPVSSRSQFIHQRADSREHAVFTFIRQPGYYAAFNSGKQITKQQRLGLGLLWSPDAGVLLQSQTNSADQAWGTRAAGMPQVYEAGDVIATFSTGAVRAGARDLDARSLTVEYPLGERGRKRVAFTSEGITVTIDHPGEFTEQIPAQGTGLRVVPEPEQTGDGLRLAGKDRLVYTMLR